MLLFSCWGLTNRRGWGLVSANPFAVKALEKATRRRCSPEIIEKHKKNILKVAKGRVSYVDANTEMLTLENSCRVNTHFAVDHTEVPAEASEAITLHSDWKLGPLPEGWEWLAFTFSEQEQLRLSEAEVREMLNTSDEVAKAAYGRMNLGSSHKWMKHTEHEVDFIERVCQLTTSSKVLDLGCGGGRHVISLSSRGYESTGCDYVKSLLNTARDECNAKRLSTVKFIEGDARSIRLGAKFDCVLCLYDVIGSFVKPNDNLRIIRTIAEHIKPGGHGLLSVMNRVITEKQAKYVFQLSKDASKLLDLPSSNVMESTGDVFNPEYYLFDKDTGIVYRKEQFTLGKQLPRELIVRDRRFTEKEITDILKAVGLQVLWSRHVRAGDWDKTLEADHPKAKEILVMVQKPRIMTNVAIEI